LLKYKTDACPYFNAAQCITIRPTPSECHNDQQCQGSERCCCYNCHKQCVPTVKVKPGQCPAQPKSCPFEGPDLSVGNEDLIKPPRRCKTDADCTGDQKCCDYCGMTCQTPIKEHSGFCPVSNEQISCVTVFERPCCSNDEDCKSTHKCCLMGDRMECVLAQKEKSGVCPPTPFKCVPLGGRCKTDAQCVGNKKCCQVKCTMECVDPI
uniref:WAP domain-containing protein n=1 Tax=Leptobrachium leishanense TaxID=445787 RepID=A0A8C5M6F1_9ANUR